MSEVIFAACVLNQSLERGVTKIVLAADVILSKPHASVPFITVSTFQASVRLCDSTASKGESL